MAFSRVNPTGYTNDNSTITAAQANQLDINQSRAIDGTAGGTYTPTGQIIISGTEGIRYQCTGAGANIRLGSRVITRQSTMSGITEGTGTWAMDIGMTWRNATESATGLFLPLDLPDGAVLNSVTARYIGAGGHVTNPLTDPGGLDLAMPLLQVLSVDSGGVATVVGSQLDTAVDPIDYEVMHEITASALAHTVLREVNRYLVRFIGERGAEYTTGALLTQVLYQATVTKYIEH